MEARELSFISKALVVEDDQAVRMFIKEVLESMNYLVFAAEDGEVGQRILDQEPDISLIVTDIIMPNGEGIDFIRNVRRRDKSSLRPHIIAISGFSGGSAFYLEAAKAFGADVTLGKPFTDLDLKDAVFGLDPWIRHAK